MAAHSHRARGFTLIEALLVLLIFSVSAAVAFPTLRDWQVRFSEKAELRTLINTFHQARGEAARRNCDVVLQFRNAAGNDQGGFRLVAETTGGEVEIRPFTSFETLRLTDCSFADNRGGFDFRGIPANNGTLQLKNVRGATYDLTISATGRIKLDKSDNPS